MISSVFALSCRRSLLFANLLVGDLVEPFVPANFNLEMNNDDTLPA